MQEHAGTQFKVLFRQYEKQPFKYYCSKCYGSELWTQYNNEIYKKCVVVYDNKYKNLFNIRRSFVYLKQFGLFQCYCEKVHYVTYLKPEQKYHVIC